MANGDSLLILGKISGVHGVKGWVKVFSHTAPKDNIFTYPALLAKKAGQWHPVKLLNGKVQGKSLIAQLDGVMTREGAELWKGVELAVDREALPPAQEGEYYWADLIGLTVVTMENIELGKITHLIETGSNDVMTVKGDKERLVPFIMGQFVKSVDLDAGIVLVDWDPDF